MIAVYIILSIVLITLMIAGHEFGHFVAAKSFGCIVPEYSIGFGPLLWKKKKGETQYSIRAIPFGGYCDIKGTEKVNKDPDGDPRLLYNMPWWKQFIVYAAGSINNLIIGFVLVFIGYIIKGVPFADLIPSTASFWWTSITSIFEGFRMLFTGEAPVTQLTGIIGAVGQVSSLAASSASLGYSFGLVFAMMGAISCNLAVINMFPVPALDGGRIILIIVDRITQKLFKKSIPEKVQTRSLQVTMILLFVLMGALVIKDIVMFFI